MPTTSSSDATNLGWNLQRKLDESGAKPHSRMSDLSRHLLEHYDEVHEMVGVRGYSWSAVTSILVSEGFREKDGTPVAIGNVKLAWSRLNKRKRKAAEPQIGTSEAHAAPATIAQLGVPQTILPLSSAPVAAGPAQLVDVRASQKRDVAFANGPTPPMVISPARPRGATPPSQSAPAKKQASSTALMLSEDDIERRVTELAERQAGRKLPIPDVL